MRKLLRVTRTALIQEKSERGRLSQKAEEKREEPCGCTEEPQTSDAESRRAARGL